MSTIIDVGINDEINTDVLDKNASSVTHLNWTDCYLIEMMSFEQ